MGEPEKTLSDNENPGWLMVCQALTGVWVFGVLTYTYVNWTHIRGLDANEVGDFLAGAAAPMAFLWLVIAVQLQRKELSLQRQELKESRLAQQKQAQETAALVGETKQSVAIARAREEEARIDRLIDTLSKRIQLRRRHLLLRYSGGSRINIVGEPNDKDDVDEVFRRANEALVKAGGLISTERSAEKLLLETENELEQLQKIGATILERVEKMNNDVLRARLDMIDLKRFCDNLASLIEWSNFRTIR